MDSHIYIVTGKHYTIVLTASTDAEAIDELIYYNGIGKVEAVYRIRDAIKIKLAEPHEGLNIRQDGDRHWV